MVEIAAMETPLVSPGDPQLATTMGRSRNVLDHTGYVFVRSHTR